MRIWQTERMRPTTSTTTTRPSARSARGCGRCGRERGTTLAALARADRHLGEHPVPAGVRRRGGRRWSCCCRWPATYGVTLDELVDAPPTGDPRVHLRPVTRNGMTMLPLTRRAGGIQAYKLVIPRPAAARPSRPDRPTRGTSGSTSSTAGCGWCSASTTSCCGPGGSRVRHPVAALVRCRRAGPGRVPQPVRQAGRARPPPSPSEVEMTLLGRASVENLCGRADYGHREGSGLIFVSVEADRPRQR